MKDRSGSPANRVRSSCLRLKPAWSEAMAMRKAGPPFSAVVAASLRKTGTVGGQRARRHGSAVAQGAARQQSAGAFSDVLGREVQMLVDVDIRRRGAEALHADHVPRQADPALPTQWRRRLDGEARGHLRRQDVI